MVKNIQLKNLMKLKNEDGGRAGRGKNYFEMGNVKTVEFDGTFIKAVIEGNDVYDVNISLAPVHDSFCTCPDSYFPCKHVYALAHWLSANPKVTKTFDVKISHYDTERYFKEIKGVKDNTMQLIAGLALQKWPLLKQLVKPDALTILKYIESNSIYGEDESYDGTTPYLIINELGRIMELLALINKNHPEIIDIVAGWAFIAWAKGIENSSNLEIDDEWIWEDFPITVKMTDYYGPPSFVSLFYEPDDAEKKLMWAKEKEGWYQHISEFQI